MEGPQWTGPDRPDRPAVARPAVAGPARTGPDYPWRTLSLNINSAARLNEALGMPGVCVCVCVCVLIYPIYDIS